MKPEPKNIEEFILDANVPKLWRKANRKKYDPKKDNCVNDLRRFALLCHRYWQTNQVIK